ncbi:MAG: VOC family protein [Rhodospirillales bacterium]|jgi:predicted enzyme related to lactoylglutathione lyase|nr:VOC family protein [Rhodospirillales bacterium]MBT4006384.1 VOC family protein [Rhodospirillales bacterium]MBT5075499.1 VOC family protein [Rhodospirillales bacterium]MBT5114261.1 VOC family protein [Rhodospirillales bacterium]MBT5673131.1 VOC family protein [Rhodospirillales bacterium]
MFASINHMAMASSNYPMVGRFYEAVFGLKTGTHRPFHGVVCSDGYAGININPKRDGCSGGLDHFGFVVDDVEEVLARIQKKWPDSDLVKRPSTRPFAAYSGNDPDCNIFDLAQKKDDKRSNMYAESAKESWNQDRYLNKFAIRTPNVQRVADFYQDVFELKLSNKQPDNGSVELTDGRVTLALMPWSIGVLEGMVIKRPGPDHIGLKVESIEQLKQDVKDATGANQYLAPVNLGGAKEADVRAGFFRQWATGEYQMCDPDGTWLDITEH